ncbi:hypothetical protein ACFV4F_17960 [Kitasatospora sp. NPDC059722]|uniref:hypothetical protein n=1 Tax=unclassified Kitasatospora TaxID=2633591 RepID=UPI00364EAA13
MTQRTAEEIRQDIRDIVIGMAPDQGLADRPDPELVEELGYHSLALLELAFALEDEYGLPAIDRERARLIRRLSDVQEYVVAELARAEASGGAA